MMRRHGLLRAAQAAAFFALLFLAIAFASRVLARKESFTRYGLFLEEPQACDVLFLGDSHGVSGVYPMELWRDHGVASYNLCGYGDTGAVSYWTLELALERMTPKLVVVEVDDIGLPNKTTKSSEDLHTKLDAFPLTPAKLRALRDLICDPEETDSTGLRYKDIAWEYVFTLGKYHGRWSELNGGDFLPPSVSLHRGAGVGIGVSVPDAYDIIDERQQLEGNTWGYLYLRRIIETCRARGIGVLFMHIPFPAEESDQEEANAVWPIAEEYGVDFIDFVALDNAVDYETDLFDAQGHLNPAGARKVTDYLGRYIRERYDVPDRRTDPAYAGWMRDCETYADYKLDLLRAQSDPVVALSLLHDAGMSAVVLIGRDAAAYADARVMNEMQNAARSHVYDEDAYALWSNAMFPLEQLSAAAAHGAPYFALIDRGGEARQGGDRRGAWNEPTVEERLGTGRDTIRASFGEIDYVSGEDGQQARLNGEPLFERGGETLMRIAVIDERTGTLAARLVYP